MTFQQITTTTDSRELADRIAAALVQRRLAACVQIGGPITSTYRWQGKVETSQEWVCTIKTTTAAHDAVVATIRELHTYDEPEIIATAITGGSDGYLNWVNQEVLDEGDK